MRIKVKKLETKKKIDLGYLSGLFRTNKISDNTAIIFQSNEDYYFEGVSKKCAQEFYEIIYSAKGPYWDVYSKSGFAIKSNDVVCSVFIFGRQYMIKNLENRFYGSNGIERYYKIKKELLVERKYLNSANFFMSLSYIFDYAKNVNFIAQFGFMSGEYIDKFEALQKKVIDFHELYSREINLSNPVKIAKESLIMASEAARFSIIAALCGKFGIKIKKSKSINLCELESLSNFIKSKNIDGIKEYFGFYSFYPYDISKPRFYEEFDVLKDCDSFDIPSDYSFRWRENAKFLVARCMDIERKCYKKIGEMTGLGELIFHIKVSELKKIDIDEKKDVENLRKLAERRNDESKGFQKEELPERLFFQEGKLYEEDKEELKNTNKHIIKAKSVSSKRIVEGIAIIINDVDEFGKFKKDSIILTKRLSPNHAALYRNAKGIISENSGSLAHAAIIAREMDMPCFIQADGLDKIKDGQYIRLNGKKGEIEILKKINYKTDGIELKAVSRASKSESIKQNKNKHIAAIKICLSRKSNKDFYWINDAVLKNSIVGTKAANLSVLYKYFSIPLGFSLATAYFKNITGSKDIDLINIKLQELSVDNALDIDNYCEKIRNIIQNIEFDHEFEKEIKINLNRLDAKIVAVRSSASCEDQKKASFAGQYDSYLNLKNYGEIITAIKNCWASYFNPRAVIYRKQNCIEDENALISVFIQKMIEPKYSGVIFTKDPNNINAIAVEVVEETCDKLVLGEMTPNFYVLDKENLSILKVKMEFELNEKIIVDIAKVAIEIEKKFGAPQDIEWCVDKADKLWILQSRPISAR